jgi:HEPN domain-containing protein/predicted nucleotidyltransferase
MVTIEHAKQVAEVLVEKISPLSVIVFGSVAKLGEGSDLDIFVVTEQDDMLNEVRKCLRDYNNRFAIDYFVASRHMVTEKFREGSPFLNLIQKEGRVLFMKNSIKEWNGLVIEDLKQAKYLLDGNFFRGACFAAYQASEKAIKANLLKRGWDLEKSHNIRRLFSISEDYNAKIVCDDDDIDFMDSIYRGRYPAEEGLLPLKAPTRKDAMRIIKIADNIIGQLELFKVLSK